MVFTSAGFSPKSLLELSESLIFCCQEIPSAPYKVKNFNFTQSWTKFKLKINKYGYNVSRLKYLQMLIFLDMMILIYRYIFYIIIRVYRYYVLIGRKHSVPFMVKLKYNTYSFIKLTFFLL